MSTPNYKGQNQPTATSGGWVSDWFGSSSPVYKPAPMPSTSTPSTPSTTASPSIAPTPTSTPSTLSAKRRRAFVVLPDGREVEVVIPCASDDDADDDAIDPNE